MQMILLNDLLTSRESIRCTSGKQNKNKNNDNSKISKLKKRTDQSPLKQPKQLWNKPT